MVILVGALGLASGFSQVDAWTFVLSEPWPWYVLWAVAYGGLAFRRRAPALVSALAFAALLGQSALDGVDQPWALLIALYSVAAHRGPRWAWGCSAAVVAILGIVSIATTIPAEAPAIAAFGIGMAVLLGLNVRGRRAYVAALLDRAEQLERGRVQEVRLAAAAERTRIARELHDIVAHGMSVMISLSDGAEAVVEQDPENSRRAVQQIGVVGREALSDMRRLLSVLHDGQEAASLAPQPGLEGLDDLVETYRSAGLPVAVTRVGELPSSRAVQVVLYRTVQEGLTNALRYAIEPERVTVTLQGGDSASGGVIVEVLDDGKGTAPAMSVGTERGLVGLRERAALFGGTVEAGPRSELDGSGWRLRLNLPRAGTGRGGGSASTADTAGEVE
ncbi:sensor histidine kinase [Rathayibacter sp. AY2B7]|uniref:sensor histidine kinase n=1 Tax=Rathayibacter sp. AY2B7 TaxID=2080571 RepID=UPI0015E42135|nr:histidine kinase [Rathayibacter sp. AY2B7]